VSSKAEGLLRITRCNTEKYAREARLKPTLLVLAPILWTFVLGGSIALDDVMRRLLTSGKLLFFFGSLLMSVARSRGKQKGVCRNPHYASGRSSY
jgi:hypothetical protein